MKLRNSLLLLITATIWGTAFVAQSVGMDYVGPMTYVCARSVIGMIVLLPVIAVLNRVGPPRAAETPEERRKGRKTLVIGGVCCGAVLCIASCTQQLTLLHTTVGKAGFMTACYILVVPLIGLLFGRRCGLKHWCSVAIALAGLYFLCMTGGGFSLDLGTLLGLCCAFLFSCHILVIDHFSTRVDGVRMSCIQFFTCAVLAGIGMLLFEQPTWANIFAAWKPILYAGAMSSGVAYTLQIIGQKGLRPTVASLIMSLESVISAISGWLLLDQALSAREIFGCVLMFGAIVLAQLPEKRRAQARRYNIYSAKDAFWHPFCIAYNSKNFCKFFLTFAASSCRINMFDVKVKNFTLSRRPADERQTARNEPAVRLLRRDAHRKAARAVRPVL